MQMSSCENGPTLLLFTNTDDPELYNILMKTYQHMDDDDFHVHCKHIDKVTLISHFKITSFPTLLIYKSLSECTQEHLLFQYPSEDLTSTVGRRRLYEFLKSLKLVKGYDALNNYHAWKDKPPPFSLSSSLFCGFKPTLIVFTNKLGCPPCKKIEPILKEMIAKNHLVHQTGKFHVKQFDISTNVGRKHIERNKISAFPTIIVYIPSTTSKPCDLFHYKGERTEKDFEEYIFKTKDDKDRWSGMCDLMTKTS